MQLDLKFLYSMKYAMLINSKMQMVSKLVYNDWVVMVLSISASLYRKGVLKEYESINGEKGRLKIDCMKSVFLFVCNFPLQCIVLTVGLYITAWEGKRKEISMQESSVSLLTLDSCTELISCATGLRFEYVAVTICAIHFGFDLWRKYRCRSCPRICLLW